MNEDLWITTVSGVKVRFNDPKPEMFRFSDIAHSLSNLCRWVGHCREFYSVAQHSVLVALLCDFKDPANGMHALLHDAAEAYLGDLATPVKRMCPIFKKVEQWVQSAICEAFCLPPPSHSVIVQIHQADKQLLSNECVSLGNQHDWHAWETVPPPTEGVVIVPQSPEEAKTAFYNMAAEIGYTQGVLDAQAPSDG